MSKTKLNSQKILDQLKDKVKKATSFAGGKSVEYTPATESVKPDLVKSAVIKAGEEGFGNVFKTNDNNESGDLVNATNNATTSTGNKTILDVVSSKVTNMLNSLFPAKKTTNNLDVDKLMQSLNEVKEKYNSKTDRDFYIDELEKELGEEPVYQTMVEPEIDEEKIKEDVQKSYEGKRELEENKLKNKYEAKTKSVEEEKQDLLTSVDSDTDNINDKYDYLKEKSSAEALRRGLARSSVALLSLNSIEKDRVGELDSYAKNLSSSLEKLENEIGNLNEELYDAMNELDIELAEKINKEIESKVSELKQEKEKAIKFNNNVEKLRQQEAVNRAERQSELEESYSKKYAGIKDRTEKEELYNLAKQQVLASNISASELVQNEELVELLGDKFYDLYYEVAKRAK
ncbi:MAG: hypothetical protein ACI4T8_02745 [Christensenellales bacterium]